jgi:hypothetical protein
MRSIILLLVLASAAAAQGAKPAARGARQAADVPMDQLAAVAGRVRALRATPASITMRVGQTIELDSVRVFAIDANGRDIGRIRAFDFGIKPNEPATAVPRKVMGVRPGITTLRVSYPTAPWGRRPGERPAATVRIVVKP